jgi:hypothetical protein
MNTKAVEIRDILSYVPLQISMEFNSTNLAIGTAFIYLHKEKPYLVTNWHNITGRDPSSLKSKHSQSAIPNRLYIQIPSVNLDLESFSIQWIKHEVKIYADQGDCPVHATWYEHPRHSHDVDVVVIPLDRDEVFDIRKSMLYIQSSDSKQGSVDIKTAICAANDPDLNLKQVMLRPSLDVFVLGFPRGMTGGANFPVWKRGSIASEPDIDIDGLPKIFIDTATREGMSGSPVYLYQTGRWISEEKDQLGNHKAVLGEGRRFIGVYSGRVGADSFQAQLGIVWKASVVEEIIDAATLGQSSFVLCESPNITSPSERAGKVDL